jgi:hypothetical protein
LQPGIEEAREISPSVGIAENVVLLITGCVVVETSNRRNREKEFIDLILIVLPVESH